MTSLTIIVFKDKPGKETYTEILKRILHSDLDKEKYEIIFIGNSHKGFKHTLITRKPLVRAFYDDTLNIAQKINGAVAESHCSDVLVWPGLYFVKQFTKPIPDDVVDPEYYLMLWIGLNHPVVNGVRFEEHKCRVNLKDTLRLLYCVGDCHWKKQVWYYGFLLKAIALKILGRR